MVMVAGEETDVEQLSTTEDRQRKDLSKAISKVECFEDLQSAREREIGGEEDENEVWLVIKKNFWGRNFTKITGISFISKKRREWILAYVDLFVINFFMMIGIIPILFCAVRNLKRKADEMSSWLLKFSILNITETIVVPQPAAEHKKDCKSKVKITNHEDLCVAPKGISIANNLETSKSLSETVASEAVANNLVASEAVANNLEASESLSETEASDAQTRIPPESLQSTEEESEIPSTSQCRTSFPCQSPPEDEERTAAPTAEEHEAIQKEYLNSHENEVESERVPETESQSPMPDE